MQLKRILAVLVLATLPAAASVAFVNSGVATSGATGVTTLSVTYSPTAGHFIAIGIQAAGTVSSMACKDNNSNALTSVQSGIATPLFEFEGVAVTGATSYTCTWTSSRKASMVLAEYSGNVGIGASNTGNTTITVTTTKRNSWGVAVFGVLTNCTFTASTGNLRAQETGGASNGNCLCIADNSAVSSGSTLTVTIVPSTGSPQSYIQEVYSPQLSGGLTLLGVGE